MKTSNKLLVATATLLLISVLVFDNAIRAEYLKGDYKREHYGMVSVPLKDFDAILDNAAHETHLDVSQGDKFEIWIDKSSKDRLDFTLENHLLKINFKNINGNRDRNDIIHIKCPRLNSLSTAVSPGSKIIAFWGTTTVGWFKQDSLRITSNAPGTISVAGQYKKLNVLTYQGEVGIGGSKIDTANFDIRNDGKLIVDDVPIGKVNYKLSEKARVTLSGNAAKQLMH